jgi:hypothetical protein
MGGVVQLKDVLNTIFEAKEPDNAGIAWYARVYGGSFAGILALGASTSEAILLKVINF